MTLSLARSDYLDALDRLRDAQSRYELNRSAHASSDRLRDAIRDVLVARADIENIRRNLMHRLVECADCTEPEASQVHRDIDPSAIRGPYDIPHHAYRVSFDVLDMPDSLGGPFAY